MSLFIGLGEVSQQQSLSAKMIWENLELDGMCSIMKLRAIICLCVSVLHKFSIAIVKTWWTRGNGVLVCLYAQTTNMF